MSAIAPTSFADGSYNQTGIVQADGYAGLPAGPLTAHAGGGQQAFLATALAAMFNLVGTVATTADSVTMKPSAPGKQYFIWNAGAASLEVFPWTGETINGGSANAGVAVAAGHGALLTCFVTGNWVGPLALV